MMNIKFLKSVLVVTLGMIAITTSVDAVTRIRQTKHNLSNWGPGPIKAAGTTLKDTEVCIYCHAPHNADSTVVPLWGHKDTAFIGYSMAKSYWVGPDKPEADVDRQPTGISKKCLSCHDGTIAIGALISGNIAMTDTGTERLNPDGTLKPYDPVSTHDHATRPGYIGKDLRSGHVISFKYEALFPDYSSATKLKSWASIDPSDQKTMFDGERKMHCHSCHDPHADWCNENADPEIAGTVGRDPLWRKECDDGIGTKTDIPNSNATVCVVCHKTTFSRYTQWTPW